MIRRISYQEFGRRISGRLHADRVPYSATIELTHRCNLHCVHCYCPPGAERREEMTTDQIKAVLAKLVEAGCLNVCLSGGEPLLHPDFLKIYVHARKLGFAVIVFTNATLIGDEHVETFLEHPPRRIEVSVYGRSRAVYERVTQVAGSHRRCYEALRRLLDAGITVELKSVVLNVNADEIEAMAEFAEGVGVDFRYDPNIHPRIDGSFKPLAYRAAPERIVAIDRARGKFREGICDYHDRMKDVRRRVEERDESIFHCSAGKNALVIDPYGRMHMCVMLRRPGYDLLAGSFREAWDGSFAALRARRPAANRVCGDCEVRSICAQCPAWSQLEHGDFETRSSFTCELTHARGSEFLGIGARTIQAAEPCGAGCASATGDTG